MPEIINAAKALDLLGEVVEGREDFVYFRVTDEGYGTCQYFADGQPSCIVGHVLAKVGIPVDDQVEWNSNSIKGVAARSDRPFGDVVFTIKALDILSSAQYEQDSAGAPDDEVHNWGAALHSAKLRSIHSTHVDEVK